MRKFRITSKLRFVTFMVVTAVILLFCVQALFPVTTVHGDTIDTYEVVEVQSGDSLWSIAEEHAGSDTNIRKFVYEIRQANDLDSADLSVGQQLLIPVTE